MRSAILKLKQGYAFAHAHKRLHGISQEEIVDDTVVEVIVELADLVA